MKKVEIRSDGEWAGVHASRAFERGERVLDVAGERRAEPDRYSIQVGENTHLHPDGAPWKYLNHSCRPNLSYDAATSAFIATRAIDEGEELSFNYLTTEWNMAEGFRCRCGAPNCFEEITGFQNLSAADKEELLSAVAPHIRALHALDRRSSGSPRLRAGRR